MANRTTFTEISDGDELSEGYFNGISGFLAPPLIRNLIRQLQDRSVVFSADGGEWAEAYTDSNGRLNSVASADTNSIFDSNKYKNDFPVGTEPFVIIEASSLSASWTDNNCLTQFLETGKWIVYCTTGTDEIKRAQIYKSLYYGTDGSDSLILDFSSVTAVKTSVTRDIGKQAHYAYQTSNYGVSGSKSANYTGTFANTGSNNDCSSWSHVYGSDFILSRWEMPNGTSLNDKPSESTTDEIGTDTTVDEINNPADCDLYQSTTLARIAYGEIIILCVGDITWVATKESGASQTVNNIDFFSDHSIPIMTAVSSENFYSIITHDLPTGSFSSTISSCFGSALVADWESGADIQYKLTNATSDTGWLTYNELSSFTAFASEPTTCIFKLIPKTTSPTTGYPSIKGFAVYE